MKVLGGEVLLKHRVRKPDLAGCALRQNPNSFRVYREHLTGGVLRALNGIGEGVRVS